MFVNAPWKVQDINTGPGTCSIITQKKKGYHHEFLSTYTMLVSPCPEIFSMIICYWRQITVSKTYKQPQHLNNLDNFSVPKSIFALLHCGVTTISFVLHAQNTQSEEDLNFWSEIMQTLAWFTNKLCSFSQALCSNTQGPSVLLYLEDQEAGTGRKEKLFLILHMCYPCISLNRR